MDFAVSVAGRADLDELTRLRMDFILEVHPEASVREIEEARAPLPESRIPRARRESPHFRTVGPLIASLHRFFHFWGDHRLAIGVIGIVPEVILMIAFGGPEFLERL
jgi:hypothetical protein